MGDYETIAILAFIRKRKGVNCLMREISVIIPTYEHAHTIIRCLNSVFAQTFKDTEVIVVDDGSTDGTGEKLKPFLDRIIYKRTANCGAPKARNAGFALSHGRFVIFLDADIVMKPEMLSTLYEALRANPGASYAYGGFRFGIARFRGERFDPERLKRVNFIHTSALIRREDFPGFDESLKRFQDWDLWLTMLKNGKRGIGVGKILFSAKPRSRFGMSQWRPKIFFSPLFSALGIGKKVVARYRAAAAIIAKKHGLAEPGKPASGERHENRAKFLWLAYLAVFAVSAFSFKYPFLGTTLSLAITIFAIALTRTRLIYGVLIMLAELIFGSLAGKTLAISFPGFILPLRFALFGIVGAFWLLRISQRRVRIPPKNAIAGVGLVLAAAGWGIANGLMRGTPLREVFFDANAYFALPIILFFFSAVENEDDQRTLIHNLKHGVIALSVLTLAALYFFGHRFPNAAGVFAYKWLRDTRIAEITALEGGTYRVFIQSQIFCMLSLFVVALGEKGPLTMAHRWKKWLWAILPAAALLVSGSRSFAAGIAAAGLIWIVIIIFSSLRRNGKQDRRVALSAARAEVNAWDVIKKLAVFAIGAIAIYAALLAFPFPPARSQASFQDMLRSRSVSQRDAATASRWSLLTELHKKIMESPIYGSGFGATVTYESQDRRIVESTGGTYTTSAFEWNYHDIAVKMGILGLLAYGFLLWSIFSIIKKSSARSRYWLIPAFFALLLTNVFSPYLNHPLGIGYLALLLALADRKPDERVTAEALITNRSPAAAAARPCGAAMSESGPASD